MDDSVKERPVVWMGDSLKQVQSFPDGARNLVGYELHLLQIGKRPKDAKPFRGVGSGVTELAIRHDRNAYWAIIALQLGERIYVLHAFQKKSKRGIATPKQDVDLVKRRYREAQEIAAHESSAGAYS